MPLGRWLRPVLAAGVTAGIVIVGEIAQRMTKDDLKALAARYPAVAATETVEGYLAGIPIIGAIANAFIAPIVQQTTGATMSEEDKSRYDLDKAILKWVPIMEIGALVIGVPLTLYFVWADLLDGPRRARMAAATAAPVAAAIPLPQAQIAVPLLAAAGTPVPVPVPPPVIVAQEAPA